MFLGRSILFLGHYAEKREKSSEGSFPKKLNGLVQAA